MKVRSFFSDFSQANLCSVTSCCFFDTIAPILVKLTRFAWVQVTDIIVGMMTKSGFLFGLLLALSVTGLVIGHAQPRVPDLLLYFDTANGSSRIMAYNPATGEKLELPATSQTGAIHASGDGRIAYIQDNDIWVLDVLNAPQQPVNITQTPNEQESRLRWTPEGHLLEYWVSSGSEGYSLYAYNGTEVMAVDSGFDLERHWNDQGWYVASYNRDSDTIGWTIWNGQEQVDLILPTLPAEPVLHTFLWTPDNHLFITLGYREPEYMQPPAPTEVFYWNGQIVQEVDNPSGDETFMLGEWSANKRLTLYTRQNFFNRWYIWDGISFTSAGVPDSATFTLINGPTEQIQDLAWMPDGRLAIVGTGDPASDTLFGHPFVCAAPCAPQVYLWDSQSLQQVTSNDFGGLVIDVHSSGSITVSDFNGLHTMGVTVFDSSLQPIFQSKGTPSTSRWSEDGNLAYCSGDALFVWNRQEAIQLSSRALAQWLMAPSSSMLCSTG